MDPVIEELIIRQESQKLRIDALEDALLNIAGFNRQEGDGSRQGLIKYEDPKLEVAPKVVV